MSPDEVDRPEDHFTDLLAASDEALAAGSDATYPAALPPELRARFDQGLAGLKLLREVLTPPGPAPPHPPAAVAPPPGGATPLQQLGRFQIRRELGRGAFGVVFLAHDPHLCREVALKVPRAEVLLDDGLRQRFVREAQVAAGLDHPNLVAVYEAGQDGALCYIVSAFCPGPTLAQWRKQREEPVPARTAALLVAALADAVQHAHERGVIHRDLKPSNILLEPFSPDNLAGPCESLTLIPRITDFGLAKVLADASVLAGEPNPTVAEGLTRTGMLLGTPNYMAPEQASGRAAVGPAADIHALGAILYELLTGRPPFRADTPLETLRLIQTEEPLPPGRLRPQLPRDLETICLKCLHKEPGLSLIQN
jgi:serine/threonine protein kinase